MSGLRTVKRDFSSNSATSSSQTTNSGEPSRQQKLTASERRLKLIQDALAGAPSLEEKRQPFSESGRTTTSGTGSISSNLKRPSPGDGQPAAKKRKLPSTWANSSSQSSAVASYSSTRTLSASLSVNSASKTSISVTSTSKSSSKAAGIFLSQEQTHILKLVEAGESLFYTGSAGKLPRLSKRLETYGTRLCMLNSDPSLHRYR